MINLLEEFRQYLKDQGVSTNTRKNYVSDLSTFVDYLKTENQYFSILTLPFVLNTSTLTSYKKWLEKRDRLSTANRRLSSLRKFVSFAIETNSISRDYTGTVSNFTITSPEGSVHTPESFEEFFKTHVSNSKTIDQYTSDINKYLISKSTSGKMSNSLSPTSFSLKGFWQWKNNPPIAPSPAGAKKRSSLRLAYFLVGTGGILIITAAVIAGTSVTIGRSRALREPIFFSLFTKKTTSSLRPLITVWDSAPSGASGLIDPTQVTLAKKPRLPGTYLERTWSKLESWFAMPSLIDPTIE